MSTYTGVTNCQKQSGFFGPPCIFNVLVESPQPNSLLIGRFMIYLFCRYQIGSDRGLPAAFHIRQDAIDLF